MNSINGSALTQNSKLNGSGKRIFLPLIMFLIIANVFTIAFISREKDLYCWDNLNYWMKFTQLGEYFFKNPVLAIKSVIYSVREDDYNYLPAFLLLPFNVLLGSSRLAYILAIVNGYAFAAVVSFVFLKRRLCAVFNIDSVIIAVIAIGMMALSPNFWHPIFSGYLDVGGIILINSILILHLRDPFPKQRISTFLTIATLITALILFRRWYAYWGLGYYVALLMEICAGAVLSRAFTFKAIVKDLYRVFLQIISSVAILFIVAPTFSHRIISTNYADIYSAYKQSGSISEASLFVMTRFGLIWVSLFVIGAILAIRDIRTRKFSIFLLIQWVVIFIAFTRTQDFDRHQLYLLLPTIYIFSSMFVIKLVSEGYRFKSFALSVISALLILNFLPVFNPERFSYQRVLVPFVTNIQHPAYVRKDIKEVDMLLNTLENILSGPNDRVYILSSSYLLNFNMLDSAYLSLGRYRDVARKILPTHDIDKRDGFPVGLLKADYVVVGDPIQYHMNPQDQRVVGIPAEMILSHRDIGTSFDKLPYEFTLSHDVKVFIYKKVQPFSNEQLNSLSDALKSYYPDREEIYGIKLNSDHKK